MARWSSSSGGMATIDLATRWPLFLASASEPFLVSWLVLGDPQVQVNDAALLIAVTLGHTVACVALLRAGIVQFLGGPRPSRRLVSMAVTLTAAALLWTVTRLMDAGAGTGSGIQIGVSAGPLILVYCAALTCAFVPSLSAARLLAVVALPGAVAGVLEFVAGPPGRQLWAVSYVLVVGGIASSYRFSVWFLGVAWEMSRTRDVQARLAVAEERLRFSRDLHDVLGRNLALIAVDSELAAKLVQRGQDGAVERMLEVRKTAEESMREVREVVAGHRRTDLDSELAGARSVLRSAGITVRVIGAGAILPPATQAALAWVVREATTNIIRHSNATTVKIDLEISAPTTSGSTAVLRIENDGTPSKNRSPDGGTGLIGLQDRLATLGGRVTAEAGTDGRFVVQAHLPLDTDSPPAATQAKLAT
jgi:two-component system sensor histidine kinase DesK